MNTFGNNFRITLFGESHGKCIGVVMDGVQPGIPLTADDFEADLERRRAGISVGSTYRREQDRPLILSGMYQGYTTGSPLTVMFVNEDTRSEDYGNLLSRPRPSHADRTASLKYNGFNDPRGGGMFSGRMTAALVAAGVVAKKMLGNVSFTTRVTEIGGVSEPEKFEKLLTGLRASGDSVGGVVQITVNGIPAGLGAPFFNSVESVAAHILFSIPGVKGVEFGAGFSAARKKGSENNDLIIDGDGKTLTNNDGGINGGISNGNDITARIAFKPAPSISLTQDTYDYEAETIMPLRIKGRHDVCIALRGAVAAEAALAVALADFTQVVSFPGVRRPEVKEL